MSQAKCTALDIDYNLVHLKQPPCEIVAPQLLDDEKQGV